jgi:hypothetical protein
VNYVFHLDIDIVFPLDDYTAGDGRGMLLVIRGR